jgi:mRNA interferase HigB
MHVISRKRLVVFGNGYPDAVTPLDSWYRLMKAGRFTNSGEMKATFATLDFVRGLAVFNIGGNRYRLVANVHYTTETNIGRVWVRHVFTHKEYDRWSNAT